jgi:hypothetical protein
VCSLTGKDIGSAHDAIRYGNVPHPAGATRVYDWYDTDTPGAGRFFTGGSWVVERDDRDGDDGDLQIQVYGTQYAADGRVEVFITVDEGRYERLTGLTLADARQLGRALMAAADELGLPSVTAYTLLSPASVIKGCRWRVDGKAVAQVAIEIGHVQQAADPRAPLEFGVPRGRLARLHGRHVGLERDRVQLARIRAGDIDAYPVGAGSERKAAVTLNRHLMSTSCMEHFMLH